LARLFQRVCSVNVNGLQVSGLRVQFSVKKTLTKEPNTGEIKIHNLSAHSRGSMPKKGGKVILVAGYPGTEATIFSGDARTIDHLHEGADWITHIQCGDGESAYRFARFSESFAPGTSVADAIRKAAAALGINTGNLEDALASASFPGLRAFKHGYAAHGKASAELDKLLRTAGLEWSIQNGALQILQGRAVAKGSAVLLTPDTGLVGSPEHCTPNVTAGPPTIKAKALLTPAIRCGGTVDIRAQYVKGQFRVNQIEHSGDTHGADWFTQLEVLA
jgi:hypothetical protein